MTLQRSSNAVSNPLKQVIDVSQFYSDPLGFVQHAYPWREPGPLRDSPGPDDWQAAFLSDLGEQVKQRGFDGITPVAPIRMATASGHGIGKSVLVAFIVNWLMSTRPDSRGTVTANTYVQLETRTWATLSTWTKRCITAPWFEVTSDRIFHLSHRDSWFVSAQSCKEENSEAFAGQHAVDSSSYFVFDEASAVPDKIWEVAHGGLTDGEPFFLVFGNATRSTGAFHRVTFGVDRGRWVTRSIDSRQCRFSNKELIKEWEEDYGSDSDFFRVRVRGLPPRASDAQFIDLDRVIAAQKREARSLPDDPLIVGVDLAWGGADHNVIRFRCGFDARSIPPIRIPGEFTREPDVMIVRLAELLSRSFNGKRIRTMFIDSAGIAGPITTRLQELGYRNVIEINFGAHSPNPKFANMRSYMWGQMKDWLLRGAIDEPQHGADNRLELDLTGPGYRLDKNIAVLLEPKDKMKARDIPSPDDADALALTFARRVAPTPVDTRPPFRPV